MNHKKPNRARICVLTMILVSLVIGNFTFGNQVNASTSTDFQDPSSCSGSWIRLLYDKAPKSVVIMMM